MTLLEVRVAERKTFGKNENIESFNGDNEVRASEAIIYSDKPVDGMQVNISAAKNRGDATIITNYLCSSFENYSTAIIFCIITMLCWGSWANTQKLAANTWRFELFYWDYVFGILFFSFISAFTLGSIGSEGRVLWKICTG